jgi:cytochrome P450
LAVRDDDGGSLSPSEVHDQCMVMFQAGHETSATALLWWSWLMASHPDAASCARREVDSVLQGRQSTPADTQALPYLSATLKEAMRLYPPDRCRADAPSDSPLRPQRADRVGGHAAAHHTLDHPT